MKRWNPSRWLRSAARILMPPRFAGLSHHVDRFSGNHGLEIGGPSGVFKRRGLAPIYSLAARIDNCNFSGHTTWEGKIREGSTFLFNKKKSPGRQYVAEASNLTEIPSQHYDFVLSSHVLEHVANPLKALQEWSRVLKPGGLLLLVLPHKDGTFDHRRPVTPLSHFVEDFEQEITEGDLTHLDEILRMHDLSLDPHAGTPDQFAERSKNNLKNRCLHHHVFDSRSAAGIVDHSGLQILAAEQFLPYHIVLLARKLNPMASPDNGAFLAPGGAVYRSSPFPSDR